MIWRPFLLNPDVGVGGMQRSDYIARRFGGEDRTRRLHATLTELGKAEDIVFRFDLLHRSVSSLDAHRLVRQAARIGRADEAVDRLFTGYFTQGLDIGRQEVLLPLGVSLGLEQAALQDEYFVARKLYPNVDFYSGIIYKALQIPTEMFTVMFALGRTSGWVSHWLEQQVDPEMKIGRPRQVYTGSDVRDYQG